MTASGLVLRTARYGGGQAGLLAIVALAQTASETLLPAVLGRAVDGVLRGSGTLTWPIIYAALVTIAMVCDVLTELTVGTSSAVATARLRKSMVRHLLRLGSTGGMATGDVTSRLVTSTSDTGVASSALIMAATAVIPPVGAVIALILIDPWLVVAFAVGFPLIALVLRAFVRDTSTVVARYLRVQGAIAAKLMEALSGIRTIAAAGTAEQETDRVLTDLPELAEHGHATWRIQAATAARGTLAVPLLQIAVLATAGVELAGGRLSPGEMLAAVQYASLGANIGPVIAQLGRLARARAGAQRLGELLERPAPRYGTRGLPPGPGLIEFRRVSAAGVLDGLDLTVPGGLAVAVVGRSGAGKSVLARLAGRLDDPDHGEILLDGVPLGELGHDALRSAVGYAFERPVLFGATLAEALSAVSSNGARSAEEPQEVGVGPRFAGRPQTGVVRENVLSASRAACADGFIRRLPDGYRTPPEDAPLSGGEMQRLGLARAFARPGRVLILDDATSSLDTVTEMQISRVIALADRTRLIVAHRAGTAARADLVAWLDGGRIRACAPHRELWADPEYREVFG